MALTSAQKAKIRYYLGYSDVSQGGSPNRLEMAMGALTADAQPIVETILTRLDTVEADLVTVTGATRAGIIEVDNGGVKWASGGTSAAGEATKQGNRLRTQLATMFGCELGRDIYGGGMSTGFVGRG